MQHKLMQIDDRIIKFLYINQLISKNNQLISKITKKTDLS